MKPHLKVRGRGLQVAALAALVATSGTTVALAQTGTAATPIVPAPGAATAQPTVVKVERVKPKARKVFRHRFTPWARPSARKVHQIIRAEARRWKISAAGLSRRVSCESRYNWAAGNGPYVGLLQFHSSTFSRGLSSIRTRQVQLVRKSTRRVREVKLIHYSDGKVVRKRGRKHRQRVVHVYTGKLPRRPAVTHGWAQLRIGAQAIRGLSAVNSSEWSCPA